MNTTQTANYADIIRDMGYVPSLRTKRHRAFVVVFIPSTPYGASIGTLEAVSAMSEARLQTLVKKRLKG
jgi:hypothetical protein